jgi:vacuolar-type H+-ATPase subunit E/Vma4
LAILMAATATVTAMAQSTHGTEPAPPTAVGEARSEADAALADELEALLANIDGVLTEMEADLERMRQEAALGGGAAARERLERLRAQRDAIAANRREVEALLDGLDDASR